MKKITRKLMLLAFLLVFAIGSVYAEPAQPGKIVVVQKDGTTLEIMRYGDEFFHYTTTSDGYIIKSKGGVYYYADLTFNGFTAISNVKATNKGSRSAEEMKFLSGRQRGMDIPYLNTVAQMSVAKFSNSVSQQKAITKGNFKGLVLLVNFKNLSFITPDPVTAFGNLLNEEGYNYASNYGSVRDYFITNSTGQFTPSFDVKGPFTLPENYEYYGENNASGNDGRVQQMAEDAINAANDADVDFSPYDNDGDGTVEMVYIYFAGYAESQGAPDDTIWPHKFQLSTPTEIGGKTFSVYATSSELRGVSGTWISTIGTTCHEYSHILGLKDVYDVDGSGSGGEVSKADGPLGILDVMGTGITRNYGKTPPYYSVYQRYQVGWLEPEELTENKEYAIRNIRYNEGLIFHTENPGEYFTFEVRDSQADVDNNYDDYIDYYDSYPEDAYHLRGLVIHHIDQSQNDAVGMTAENRWKTNSPNNAPAHMCAKFVHACNSSRLQYTGDWGKLPYPGTSGNTEFSPKSAPAAKDWAGKDLKLCLTDIKYENEVVTFTNYFDNGIYDTFPGIKFTYEHNAATFEFDPRVINLSNSDVTWYVDGTKTELGATAEEIGLGEHKLVAKFYNDGETEFITMYFTIVE